MNVALPGLIFSSVVPAFNSHNVSSMGPLFLQAFVWLIFSFFKLLLMLSSVLHDLRRYIGSHNSRVFLCTAELLARHRCRNCFE